MNETTTDPMTPVAGQRWISTEERGVWREVVFAGPRTIYWQSAKHEGYSSRDKWAKFVRDHKPRLGRP